jgi:hypothetical protein
MFKRLINFLKRLRDKRKLKKKMKAIRKKDPFIYK